MIGGFGANEILLVAILIFILFGATKIPELARSLGRGMAEFKKAQKEAEIELMELERELKQGKPKRKRLEEVAKTMGIDTDGKTDDELIEEISKYIAREKAEP